MGKFLIVDDRGIRRLVNDLEVFAKKALPYAVRNSLNRSAFEARRVWVAEAGRTMILRNTWTARSIRVDMVKGMDPRNMVATVGSTADYMAAREEGKTNVAHGRHGVPIPTLASRGGAKARLVQRPNRMANIHLQQGRPGTNRKQRNAIAMKRAMKAGTKYVFLETEQGGGLFKITGGRRKLQVKKLWDLSKKAQMIHRNPMLQRTLQTVGPRLVDIHHGSLIEQARRNKILGY